MHPRAMKVQQNVTGKFCLNNKVLYIKSNLRKSQKAWRK